MSKNKRFEVPNGKLQVDLKEIKRFMEATWEKRKNWKLDP
jgi:hypothetical protein